jgi:hypothetical protein
MLYKYSECCFERPLAIIRSEKPPSSSSVGWQSPKASNGIPRLSCCCSWYPTRTVKQDQKRGVAKRSRRKKKKRSYKYCSRIGANEGSSPGRRSVPLLATPSTEGHPPRGIKGQHKAAKVRTTKAKDLTRFKQRYAAEVARANAQKNVNKATPGLRGQ